MRNNLGYDRIAGLLEGLRTNIVRENEVPVILEWIASCYRQGDAPLDRDAGKELDVRRAALDSLDQHAVDFVCQYRTR